jgi:quercetin dioxygenase-like cupin family protein
MSTSSPQPVVHVRHEDSDGHVAVIESTMPAGAPGPPLHKHDFDEAFYVVEGELTFQLGDELRTAGPGECVFAPRNAVHTLANLSDAAARYVLVCTPAGFERRFDRRAADPPAFAFGPIPEVTIVGPRIGERG